MSNEDIKKVMLAAVEESKTELDQLIQELISTAISQRYKTGGNEKSRRDFMEKMMNQYISDNMENS